ncbi:MAG: DUF5385 family protein [Mycoplasma sp.]|nr:DUF5385 family protein [Mycoplasma sp.]
MEGLFGIILVVALVGGIFYFIKKKKKGTTTGGEIRKRHDGDEVWKAVKDFLRSNNEKGKEIVETYVAKRPNPDFINRSLPKEEQKKQKIEIKNRKKEEKQRIKEDKAIGKKQKKEVSRELYVILFVTRNAKTREEDKPRAIECEVKNIPTGKRQTERKILINGEKDYKTESEWILPIKQAEEKKARKEYESKQRWNKFNPFRKKNGSNVEKELTPDQIEKIRIKEEKKEAKLKEKMKREKEKWEKKETVVKSKK